MLNTTDTTTASTDQPQSHGAPGRRTLAFGGMAAAIAGLMSAMPIDPAAAANANEDDPDLVLIQLCERIVAARGEQGSLQARAYDLLPTDPDHDETFSRIRVLDAKADKFAEQAAKLSAQTRLGVQARASALSAMMPVNLGIDDMVPINWHCGMLDALLRDLTGRA